MIAVSPWETCELSLQDRIDATACLDKLLASPELAGIHTEAVLRHGGVAAQLIRIAQEHGVDLLVTGTRAYHGLNHLVLGSVAEELAQCAPCPVLTVGPRVTTEPHGPLRNIVLATNLNPGAAAGVAYARSFAQLHGATLWVTHAVPASEGSLAVQTANNWLNKLVPEQDRVVRVFETGALEDRAVELAKRQRAELLMMGPGLGGLLPRVAGRVACPVMTVRYAIPMLRPRCFGAEAITSQK